MGRKVARGRTSSEVSTALNTAIAKIKNDNAA
jgi:hypothetical protein